MVTFKSERHDFINEIKECNMVDKFKMELDELQKVTDSLRENNSTKDKMTKLRGFESEQLKNSLHWIYNPFITLGITKKQLKDHSELGIDLNNEIMKYMNKFHDEPCLQRFLNPLITRELSGHNAIGYCQRILVEYHKYTDLILNIINRELPIRLGIKSINKVIPHCIPTFEVTLAKSYTDKAFEKFDLDRTILSTKIDGLRCITMIKDGEPHFYSRTGKEINTLGKIKDELKEFLVVNPKYNNYVLDGELCIIDKDGKEDFKAITKEYNKKNHTIENPKYIVFDIIEKDVFAGEKASKVDYCDRIEQVEDMFKSDISNMLSTMKPVTWLPFSEDNMSKMKELQEENGWEGLMVRFGQYEGKRTNKLLKIKKFHDKEFTVIGTENTVIRMITKDGIEVSTECMGNVIIDLDGTNTCEVGSGFSMEERLHYFENPEEIIGNEITVQYFEWTEDANGKPSLRFPTVKVIHDGKRKA